MESHCIVSNRYLAAFLFGFLFMNLSLFPGQKKIKLEIDKILELGKQDLLFGSIASVCEDEDRNFYVLDKSEHQVFKFSPEGKLILTFGQKGQGPGDFQNPHLITCSLQNHVVVADELYNVSFLNPDGTFVKRIHLDGRLGVGFIGENRYYAWIWQPEDQKQVMVDSQNTMVESFYRVPKDLFSVSAPDSSGRLVMFNFARHEYSPSLLFAHFGRYSAVAVGDRYNILILDQEGRILRRIQREIQPERISKQEKKYLINHIEKHSRQMGWPKSVVRKIIKKVPDEKVFFDRILLTEKHVFVFRIKEDIAKDTGQIPVDIFSIQGEFLGTCQVAGKPIFLSDRDMYFDRSDPAGNLYLVKSAYKIIAK
jgi:hypothetical protein